MLSIDNQPLPEPAELVQEGFAAPGGEGPGLLRLRILWTALAAEEAARACGLAQGSFTLRCLDLRRNAQRAFPAGLTALRAELLGPGCLNLWMTLEERSA